MAVGAHIDLVEDLEMVEEAGALVYLKRKIRVVGLQASTDYQVLYAALAASGVPAYGSTLVSAPNLSLAKRSVKLIDGDKGVCDVTLEYDHLMRNPQVQDLDSPQFGLVVGEVSATLDQVKSNLDGDGNPIELTHVYSEDVAVEPEWPGITKKQGCEIEYHQPNITLKYQGVKTIAMPWLLARALIGTINARAWSGSDPHTWMCTNVTRIPHDLPNRYEFQFEFQYRPDTWNPTAVFQDERTNAPPPGLVEGVGYKYIRKHPEVDFEAIMGMRVQGG